MEMSSTNLINLKQFFSPKKPRFGDPFLWYSREITLENSLIAKKKTAKTKIWGMKTKKKTIARIDEGFFRVADSLLLRFSILRVVL